MVSDTFLYLHFCLVLQGFDSVWMITVILLAVVSEMAGTVTVMIGASRRYDGPMGKSDRAFVFGTLALWCGLGWSVAPLGGAHISEIDDGVVNYNSDQSS